MSDDIDVRPLGFGAAPDTGASYVNDDSHELTLSVERKSDGSVELSASAWDQEGVGVAGVSIRLSEDDFREIAQELAKEIEGGGDA